MKMFSSFSDWCSIPMTINPSKFSGKVNPPRDQVIIQKLKKIIKNMRNISCYEWICIYIQISIKFFFDLPLKQFIQETHKMPFQIHYEEQQILSIGLFCTNTIKWLSSELCSKNRLLLRASYFPRFLEYCQWACMSNSCLRYFQIVSN